jgi:hypothetical protein
MPPLSSQLKLKPNAARPVSNVPVPTDAGIVDIRRHGQCMPSAPQQGCGPRAVTEIVGRSEVAPVFIVLLQRRRRGESVRSLPPSQKRLTTSYPYTIIGIASIAILRILFDEVGPRRSRRGWIGATSSSMRVKRWLTGLGLAPASVRKVHRVLSMVLAYAASDGRLAVTPRSGF